MANINLSIAKQEKNDEFYTQYHDIEVEMNAYLDYDKDVFKGKTVLLPCDDPEWSNFTKYFAQKFETLGLKKLISTSFAVESKKYKEGYQPSLFEQNSPQYAPDKTRTHGKIFILDRDNSGDGRINYDDLQWDYLKGDGDFRSKEVKALRDEADIIITNPPFSLFSSFLSWILEADKKFVIIGNMSALHYKEVFPLIKENKIWVGKGSNLSLVFRCPEYTNNLEANRKFVSAKGYDPDDHYIKKPAICWFTNIDHGRRHQPLSLMTMEDNIRYSKHKEINGIRYKHYYNYDAIDVPFIDAIPSDYDGVMGVPDTLLNIYNPDQFEIIGSGSDVPKTLKHISYKEKGIITYEKDGVAVWTTPYTVSERKIGNSLRIDEGGLPGSSPYSRILVRLRKL